jgi:hypothetical protein
MRLPIRLRLLLAACVVLHGGLLYAQQPFLSGAQWTLLRDEASGLGSL